MIVGNIKYKYKYYSSPKENPIDVIKQMEVYEYKGEIYGVVTTRRDNGSKPYRIKVNHKEIKKIYGNIMSPEKFGVTREIIEDNISNEVKKKILGKIMIDEI